MNKTNRKRIFRFTIVELLVVIAIITILAGILLPALKKSKETVRRIECGNNMKQLGTAWNLYNSDNDGYMPKCLEGSSQDEYVLWVDLIGPVYLNLDCIGSGYYSWIRASNSPLWCNTLSTLGNDPSGTVFKYKNGKFYIYNPHPAYGMYYYGAGGMPIGTYYSAIRKISHLKKPSEMTLFADTKYHDPLVNPKPSGTFYFNYALTTYPGIHFRHNSKAGMLFCDGHYNAVSYEQLLPATPNTAGGPWYQY